jgi:ribosomal protein S18 acetylase RimI-like enzyme
MTRDFQLIAATETHVLPMMRWFATLSACKAWGGTKFRFPFTQQTFIEDLALDQGASFSLVDNAEFVVGFGQYRLLFGRCHLMRIAVHPARRGQGIGLALMRRLMEFGCIQLVVDKYSLFVAEDNQGAIRLYQKLGFTSIPYPGENPNPRNHFMVSLPGDPPAITRKVAGP